MCITSLLPDLARPRPDDAGGAGEFRVTDDYEVADLLAQLVERHVPLGLTTPDGVNYTTELVSVDAKARRISFATSTRDLRVRNLVDADEAMAVAYLDQVRLQFDLAGMVLVHGAKDSVLQAQWPAAMYRFQRRESYRVRPLEHQKPVAHLRRPGGDGERLNLRVIDVSLGGLALLMTPPALVIPPGTRLDDVEVELDALTRLDASLRVVHVSVLGNGSQVQPCARLGCEWLRLGSEGTRALQRYIEQTQKRQKLLAAVVKPACS
jgi:c-di-GMP-binding flagellar brake protein YcgR